MDYNFISVGDFRILEESGLLLESGTYDGQSGVTVLVIRIVGSGERSECSSIVRHCDLLYRPL